MKIADQRHPHLDNRSLHSSHHILCDGCATTFSHEPSKGTVAECPHCHMKEEIAGIDQPAT